MTTIHAYTASQQLVDGSSSDWRKAGQRQNLIPAGTGAAQSVVAASAGGRALCRFLGARRWFAVLIPPLF